MKIRFDLNLIVRYNNLISRAVLDCFNTVGSSVTLIDLI